MQLPNQSRSKLSYYITIIFALLLTALVVASCQKQNEEAVTDNRETTGASTTVQAVAEARGLTPDDILCHWFAFHALAQVHRGFHTGAMAGLRLRRIRNHEFV